MLVQQILTLPDQIIANETYNTAIKKRTTVNNYKNDETLPLKYL